MVHPHTANLSQPLKQGAHIENAYGERSPLCAKSQAMSRKYLGHCHVPKELRDLGQNYVSDHSSNFSAWAIGLYCLGVSTGTI